MRLLLPTPPQTLFLRACLLDDETCRAAWQEWQEWAGNAKALFVDDWNKLRGMLPLLHVSLSRSGAPVEKGFQPYLRSAAFYEQLRNRTFLRVCRAALNALETSRVSAIMLRGAALSATAYPGWGIRHCHDLDLLVSSPQVDLAINALTQNGFMEFETSPATAEQAVILMHDSGFKVALHRKLLRIAYYRPPLAKMFERRRPLNVADLTGQMLAPEDMLLHICGHASCGTQRCSLSWVADAFLLIKSQRMLDWRLFCETVAESRLPVPVYAMLDYLAQELEAPIPQSALHHLQRDAAAAETRAFEAACTGLRRGARGSVSELLGSASDWRTRALLLRWMLFPSIECLSWSHPIDGIWKVPVLYLTRPLPWRPGVARSSAAVERPDSL